MKPLEKEDKPLPKIYFKTVEVGVIMSLKNMAAAKTLYSKDSTENLILPTLQETFLQIKQLPWAHVT